MAATGSKAAAVPPRGPAGGREAAGLCRRCVRSPAAGQVHLQRNRPASASVSKASPGLPTAFQPCDEAPFQPAVQPPAGTKRHRVVEVFHGNAACITDAKSSYQDRPEGSEDPAQGFGRRPMPWVINTHRFTRPEGSREAILRPFRPQALGSLRTQGIRLRRQPWADSFGPSGRF